MSVPGWRVFSRRRSKPARPTTEALPVQYELLRRHFDARALAGDAHAPAGGSRGDREGRLVVAELHTSLHARLLGKRGVEIAANPDLMPPVLAARGLREIREIAAAEVHSRFHQLPADAGDHLFAPRVKQAGKIHACGGGRAPELTAGLDEDCARAESAGLDRGDGSGGAATDDEDVGRNAAERGRRLGCDDDAGGGDGAETGEKGAAFHGRRIFRARAACGDQRWCSARA